MFHCTQKYSVEVKWDFHFTTQQTQVEDSDEQMGVECVQLNISLRWMGYQEQRRLPHELPQIGANNYQQETAAWLMN